MAFSAPALTDPFLSYAGNPRAGYRTHGRLGSLSLHPSQQTYPLQILLSFPWSCCLVKTQLALVLYRKRFLSHYLLPGYWPGIFNQVSGWKKSQSIFWSREVISSLGATNFLLEVSVFCDYILYWDSSRSMMIPKDILKKSLRCAQKLLCKLLHLLIALDSCHLWYGTEMIQDMEFIRISGYWESLKETWLRKLDLWCSGFLLCLWSTKCH